MLDRHLAGEFHVCEQRQGHIWAASSVVFLYASTHDEFSHDLATQLETRVVRSLAMQVNLELIIVCFNFHSTCLMDAKFPHRQNRRAFNKATSKSQTRSKTQGCSNDTRRCDVG